MAPSGFVMIRGTLMVLKRILVTTLSALGLGALAAGTASGQSAGDGNIPAPNIFDDQITCSMNVPPTMGPMAAPRPTVIPEGSMTSPLDDIIGMGDRQLNTTTLTDPDDAQALLDLGYVIPADGSNCGRGLATVNGVAGMPFNAVTDNMGTPNDPADDNVGEGAVATDVAAGYTAVLDEFKKVYGDPGMADSTGTAPAR